MAEQKAAEDGFKELGDGEEIDPLSIAIHPPAAKDEASAGLESQKGKGNLSMNDKLKSVFGNDVLFEDQVPKTVHVHRPKSRPPPEQSPAKGETPGESEKLKLNLLSPSPPKSSSKLLDSPSLVKTPREEAAKHSLQVKAMEDEDDDGADKKASKMRYKDLVANSDVFEEERIEATFISTHTTMVGTLKLGQFMVD